MTPRRYLYEHRLVTLSELGQHTIIVGAEPIQRSASPAFNRWEDIRTGIVYCQGYLNTQHALQAMRWGTLYNFNF